MTSRAFKARTGHSDSNPQLCGLTSQPIQEGDWCLYLVCHGSEARPEYQVRLIGREKVEGSRYERNLYESARSGLPFKSVFTGKWESYKDARGKTKRRRVYEWQEVGPDGRSYPVEVWSQMVLLSAAETLGYDIPRDNKGKVRKTVAHEGDRTRGHEHRVSKEPENALTTLARAFLDDEEQGLVPPAEEAETPAETPAEDKAPF